MMAIANTQVPGVFVPRASIGVRHFWLLRKGGMPGGIAYPALHTGDRCPRRCRDVGSRSGCARSVCPLWLRAFGAVGQDQVRRHHRTEDIRAGSEQHVVDAFAAQALRVGLAVATDAQFDGQAQVGSVDEDLGVNLCKVDEPRRVGATATLSADLGGVHLLLGVPLHELAELADELEPAASGPTPSRETPDALRSPCVLRSGIGEP